jgi:UDP-N-acetylglucosamine transferase subunit ALG13
VTAPAAGARGPAGPRIVVTVGTDHHPFDRLIGWTNAWLRQHPEHVPAAFVQSGAASVAPACPGSRFVEAGQLSALLDSADVIVCHGGPATIAEAWARGQLPIVVPRLPQLGEHVDDHQVDFCRKVAELGRVRLAQTPADFAGLLDEAARDQRRFRADLPQGDIGAVIARFGELVDDLCSSTRPRWPLIDRGRRVRRRPAKGVGAPAGPGSISPDLEPAPDTYCHAHGGSARSGLAGKVHEEQE